MLAFVIFCSFVFTFLISVFVAFTRSNILIKGLKVHEDGHYKECFNRKINAVVVIKKGKLVKKINNDFYFAPRSVMVDKLGKDNPGVTFHDNPDPLSDVGLEITKGGPRASTKYILKGWWINLMVSIALGLLLFKVFKTFKVFNNDLILPMIITQGFGYVCSLFAAIGCLYFPTSYKKAKRIIENTPAGEVPKLGISDGFKILRREKFAEIYNLTKQNNTKQLSADEVRKIMDQEIKNQSKNKTKKR